MHLISLSQPFLSSAWIEQQSTEIGLTSNDGMELQMIMAMILQTLLLWIVGGNNDMVISAWVVFYN